MSKAGYSYDNAPMERYYNTRKNEFTYMNTKPKRNSTKQLKNLLTYGTTMSARTLITVTKHYLKQGMM